jgi:branched-chain amino acid transport system substrate-binding protein
MKTRPDVKWPLLLAFLILVLPLNGWCQSLAPIRIGATLSLTGRFAEPSAMIRDGYRLWVKQVNQRGGLLNRPVALILHDDQSDPQTAFRHYQQLVYDDRVDLVLSPYGTPLTLQASQVTESRQMVMLACAASGKAIWNRGYRYVFGMYALADRYFIGLLDLMARKGLRSACVLYEDSPFTIDVADGADRWANRFGITVNQKKAFASGPQELPRLLDQAKKTNADGLLLAAYPPDAYLLLDLLSQSDWRPKALGMTIAPIHPDFHHRAGAIAEGIFGPSQWEPDERIPFPGTTKFIQDFNSAYRKLPSYHAGSAYASCQILERAIVEVGDIDHQRIRDYISALDTVTVIGRFKVDHHGKQVGHNPILIQWQAGKKEIVYPTKMRTAPPRF